MRLQTILLTLIIFVLSCSTIVLAKGLYYWGDGTDNVVGTIRALPRNTVQLYDEQDRVVKEFVDLPGHPEFHVGDRVRIYYYPRTRIIQHIKKMTSVPYQAQGQNTGYLLRAKEK